jgi:hypothetical protein
MNQTTKVKEILDFSDLSNEHIKGGYILFVIEGLIGEIKEIKNVLDLDRLIRETLTHNDE